MDKKGNEIIVVCNFTPVLRENYRIGMPFAGTYSEVMNTDWTEFGGSGISNGTDIATEDIPMHGFEQSAALTLPPLSVMYFKCTRKKPKRKPRVKKEANAADTAEKPKRTRKKADAGDTAKPKKPRAKSTGKTAAEKSDESADQ